MGSGTFPLYKTDTRGQRLLGAAKEVREVCDEMVDAVYSGDSGGGQFDNAASDGGSLALLRLAASLIEDEVVKAKP